MQISGTESPPCSVSEVAAYSQGQNEGHESSVAFGKEVRALLTGPPVENCGTKEHSEPSQFQTKVLPPRIPVHTFIQNAKDQKRIDAGLEIRSLLDRSHTPLTRSQTKPPSGDAPVKVELPDSTEDSSISKAPFVSVRGSEIDGKGAFADKSFAAGEKVGEYTGKIVLSHFCKPHPEHFYVVEIEEEDLERDNIDEKIQYLNNDTFVVWSGVDLKGTPMEFGINGTSTIRYLNHSKEPNVELKIDFKGSEATWSEKDKIKVNVMAIRNINSGEELCFDYLYGNKKRINFKKNLVMDVDDFKGARHTIESILPVAIFGKKGYVIEQGEKRKLCIDQGPIESIIKRIRQTEKVAEKAGVSIDVLNATTRKSFHRSMSEDKWNRYGDFWNYISSDGDRELDNENEQILKELIDDLNNEGEEQEYRLKLLHTTEYFWVVDNMVGDWKTRIKPKTQAIRNTATAAGVTENLLKAEKLSDFHDEKELSDKVWRLCANQWNRLVDEGQGLTDCDRKALKEIRELVSEHSKLSRALKNKLRHTTNVLWAEAGYSVDWQLYASSIEPRTAVSRKKSRKKKRT
ncbi:SET domain-containing protein [Endozoicomonas lisbonensis]|uniref:SET domain-containing protein n=1 Tax=Endozoicomonas lisbonensis TaxID=3120522 RepID=A0ABV2SKC0_9GAMM